jgi:hypothetical protein
MFNYIKVEFPDTSTQPQFVYYANIYQNRYSHELASIKFRDWGIEYSVVTPGTPVKLTIYGLKNRRYFYGYIHHIKPEKTPGKNFTEILIIGGSYPMRQASQTVYKNVTADKVIKQIATKYNFVSYAVAHPRVYPQIAQAGHTDWELMVRLAKQCGYTLRAQNTELYFQPILEDFKNYRTSAPKFIMRKLSDPLGSTIYSFNPLIGETLTYDDASKAAIAISGTDKATASPLSITKQKGNTATRKRKQAEFFDMYDTNVVASDVETASFEASAADDRNSFPYRAQVEVLGNPDLRPDMPVFLDGLGPVYSGYWVILATEHKIIEEKRNMQRYTTILTVGIDSLGSAANWEDSSAVTAPDYTPTRTIIPNVKQTNVVPTTSLNIPAQTYSPQSNSAFTDTQNRSAPNGYAQAPLWQSETESLNNIIEQTPKSPIIVQRLLRRSNLL